VSRKGDVARLHEEMPTWVDTHLKGVAASWRALEDGKLDYSLDDLVWYLMHSDPARFAETNFVERPENGGGLWRLYDWQKESLRYEGDLVNKSGAGTGKTRELLILILHTILNTTASALYVANREVTLDELWSELEWVLSQNAWIRSQIPDDCISRKPLKVELPNGNRAIFRLTGHDGESCRGVHVHQGLILADEVAKYHNPQIFSELYRAAEHGTRFRLYSVPDGRRDTEFYRISSAAVPIADMGRTTTGRRSLEEAGSTEAMAASIKWGLVCWTKEMLPPPHWTPEVKALWVRRYGGEDTSEYRRNVLGQDGEPENVVFSWPKFIRCIRVIPEYVAIHVVWDDAARVVRWEAQVPTPGWTYDESTGSTAGALGLRRKAEEPRDGFNLLDLLRREVPPLSGRVVAGYDFGKNPDPCEALFFQVSGSRRRCVARIHLKGASYATQRAAIAAIHIGELDGVQAPEYGLGLDATGVGSAVEDELREYVPAPTLSGYVWNAVRALTDPAGHEVKDERGRVRTVSHKETATQLLEAAVDEAHLELPPDADFVTQFTSHTSRPGVAASRLFATTGDHLIDAARAAVLRHKDVEDGLVHRPSLSYSSSQRASGVERPVRSAVLSGGRVSLALRREKRA